MGLVQRARWWLSVRRAMRKTRDGTCRGCGVCDDCRMPHDMALQIAVPLKYPHMEGCCFGAYFGMGYPSVGDTLKEPYGK